ncbi:tyrosine-type recombinase/integrase [Mesorhizobium sp. NBSH29]|uniref:tyrosine-type recombinase/integrase n=1 Tax=Mesorhizobium sp. NBSH29 TaxID=2654249 RepID=UPI00189694D6|nr:tyrosine-type recombinase/integrase [Mesorhizobium sp. NBSH29]QPC87071.1 tyrosine-type recombinase/integrase [Mesorhizobium sp. NBSH29]
MPRSKKPPRLWLRTETDSRGNVRPRWVIKDGTKHVRTGCFADQAAEAGQKLAEYIAEKHEPQRGGLAAEVFVADVLSVYLEEKADQSADPKRVKQTVIRLNEFFGDRSVKDIKGPLCRKFARQRGTDAGARRDLVYLSAALHYYHENYELDSVPRVTLPPKGLPRDRFLTRTEAAALLRAARGSVKVMTDGRPSWHKQKDPKRAHLVRLILIGLYTGTRPGAILDLQWIRTTTGGWADLDSGVIFRRADGERVAHNKRKPPVKIARKLLGHLRRWRRIDGWDRYTNGIRHIVHYHGQPITKLNKAFRSAVAAAGLSGDVTPHILRHTRGTWLAQAGVPAGEAAASLGLTVDEYERTYLHNDPNFQQAAADAY